MRIVLRDNPALFDSALFQLRDDYLDLLERFEESFDKDEIERGRALEALACCLLQGIKCFHPQPDIKTRTNQIDVLVVVRRLYREDPFLSVFNTCFVCECKNERRKVSVREVHQFAQLMRKRSDSPVGIIFSRLPLSGGPTRDAILAQRELRLREELYVLNVCHEDLVSIAEGKNFLTLLRSKYVELVVDALRPIELM